MSEMEPQQQQQTEQPPPGAVTRQAYSTNSPHGSVGALVGVLALVTILGIIAGVIGRLCSGRQFMGNQQYDLEGWVEKKCSSCIDGNLAPPPSNINTSHDSVPVTMSDASPEESNQPDPSPPQNPPTA